MRGDSLRDLYAKTLALVGLAVLAGAGALVDYWPAGFSLPLSAPAPSIMPQPADTRAIAREPLDVALLGAETHIGPRLSTTVAVARDLAAVPVYTQVAAANEVADTISAVAPVLPAPVTSVADQALVAGEAPSGVTATLSEPAVSDSGLANAEFHAPMRASVAGVGGDNDGDGLLASAFKKTGTSIVKTGARAGTSIFDAFRVASGMVRRALPTN